MLFKNKKEPTAESGSGDFDYLSADSVYLDSACQSLRPRCVIDSMNGYYTNFNSCGERVKYDWGLKVDDAVHQARNDVLKLLKLSQRKYFVSFTLNTTYGLNLILSQLKIGLFNSVITSDIEHNSVFLSTLAFSKRASIPRIVLNRETDGSINLDDINLTKPLVVLNAVSNIDGRQLKNIKQVIKSVHDNDGMVIIDAAQAMSHYYGILANTDADAVCFSSHKMYGPSLGVIVAKRDLIKSIEPSFLGGGMVDDVLKSDYVLLSDNTEHIHTVFEPGLQSYAEIVGFGEATRWLSSIKATDNHVMDYATQLFEFLNSSNGFHVLNNKPTPTICFYHDKYDAHLLAGAMSDQGIMARSGHFCAHYYLAHRMKYPPLVRLSLGLHNRQSDVDKFIDIMKGLTK